MLRQERDEGVAQVYLDLAEYNRVIQSYSSVKMYANESRSLYEKYGLRRQMMG